MNIRTAFPLVLLAFALALSACGNKGPLLPPPAPAPEEEVDAADGVVEPSAAEIDAGAEADPVPADRIDPPPTTTPPLRPVDEAATGGDAADESADGDN